MPPTKVGSGVLPPTNVGETVFLRVGAAAGAPEGAGVSSIGTPPSSSSLLNTESTPSNPVSASSSSRISRTAALRAASKPIGSALNAAADTPERRWRKGRGGGE